MSKRLDPIVEARIARTRIFVDERVAQSCDVVNVPGLTVEKFVRSNIGNSIECDWTGEDVITFRGIQGVRLNEETGRIEAGYFGRSDFLRVSCGAGGYAWATASRHAECGYTIEVEASHGKPPLTDVEERFLRAAAEFAIQLNSRYVEQELMFLNKEIWRELDGMTPDEAVDWLVEHDWHERVIKPEPIALDDPRHPFFGDASEGMGYWPGEDAR